MVPVPEDLVQLKKSGSLDESRGELMCLSRQSTSEREGWGRGHVRSFLLIWKVDSIQTSNLSAGMIMIVRSCGLEELELLYTTLGFVCHGIGKCGRLSVKYHLQKWPVSEYDEIDYLQNIDSNDSAESDVKECVMLHIIFFLGTFCGANALNLEKWRSSSSF